MSTFSSIRFNFDNLKKNFFSPLLENNNPYNLTLRGDLNRKLTISELDNNFKYLLNNIIGTQSEIPYFGSDGFLKSDSGFSRTQESTRIENSFFTLNYPQFTGTGSNDLSVFPADGYYTGPTNSVYTITISATGSNDFFNWSNNLGASGSNVEIVAYNAIHLDSNITLGFKNSSGHHFGDTWTFDIIEILSLFSSGNAIGNGGIVSATVDQTNNVSSVIILGDATQGPSGAVYGLFNNSNNASGLVVVNSDDGQAFQISVQAGDDTNKSQINISSTVTFYFSTGHSYTFPTNSDSGALVNDGSGNLSFTSGFSGTYSTGEGMIVTVVNGIITGVA
jgi:hypothetical protein